jgi:hypothetical protein
MKSPTSRYSQRPQAAVADLKRWAKQMGYLVSIVVADPPELKFVAEASEPLARWKGFDASGIIPRHLVALHCALVGDLSEECYVRLSAEHTRSYLESSAEDGGYVQVLPKSFVELLADVPLGEATATAKKWSDFPLMDFRRVTKDLLPRIVLNLSDLSRLARDSEKVLIIHLIE